LPPQAEFNAKDQEMSVYPKWLTVCKLSELQKIEICGKFKTLSEIATALGGSVNGEWINIRGPGHGPSDRSLGIKFDKTAPDGFVVNSFAGDDLHVCRSYVKALLSKIGYWGMPS
jgi:hypothetical protein